MDAARPTRNTSRHNIDDHDVSRSIDNEDYKHYSAYTVKDLKTELKRRNLTIKGLKSDLVERLVESDKSGNERVTVQDTEETNSPNNTSAINGGKTIDYGGHHHHHFSLSIEQQRKMEREERQKIVLWKKPFITLQYFIFELIITLQLYWARVVKHRKSCSFFVVSLTCLSLLYFVPGNHQKHVQEAEEVIVWCWYWIGLGILSSVGLGTGLHTFILYLGPHIAQVTLAAWECQSLDFPEPPYPNDLQKTDRWEYQYTRKHDEYGTGKSEEGHVEDNRRLVGVIGDLLEKQLEGRILRNARHSETLSENVWKEWAIGNKILCPVDGHTSTVSLLTIMSKVRLEAFMWGVGTAIGELPPYFMARAARLSGVDLDDEDLEEVEKLEELESNKELDLWTRMKKAVFDLVRRMGFFGILVCASIPNPLFDLAGITCGHCLIPFWTFFGATLIGKAIIKMHIQKTFVILSFSKTYVETVLQLAGDIPMIGPYIQSPFNKALNAQRNSLHRKPGEALDVKKTSALAWIFEKVVLLMVAYFLLSIINSMAQSYDKRLHEAKRRAAPRSEVKVQ